MVISTRDTIFSSSPTAALLYARFDLQQLQLLGRVLFPSPVRSSTRIGWCRARDRGGVPSCSRWQRNLGSAEVAEVVLAGKQLVRTLLFFLCVRACVCIRACVNACVRVCASNCHSVLSPS